MEQVSHFLNDFRVYLLCLIPPSNISMFCFCSRYNYKSFFSNCFTTTETMQKAKHDTSIKRKPITKWSIEQSVSNRALDTGHLPKAIEKSNLPQWFMKGAQTNCSTEQNATEKGIRDRPCDFLTGARTASVFRTMKKAFHLFILSIISVSRKPKAHRCWWIEDNSRGLRTWLIPSVRTVSSFASIRWGSYTGEASPPEDGNNKNYTFPFHFRVHCKRDRDGMR